MNQENMKRRAKNVLYIGNFLIFSRTQFLTWTRYFIDDFVKNFHDPKIISQIL